MATPGGKWPVILKLGWEKPRLVETWKLSVTKDPVDTKRFTFTLSGSRTGADGVGASNLRFVSKSGRIVIEPADWDVDFALLLPGIKPPNQFSVNWKVVPMFRDLLVPLDVEDSSRERVVTVAQGLTNGKHTLEITDIPRSHVIAIRVYRPPVPGP